MRQQHLCHAGCIGRAGRDHLTRSDEIPGGVRFAFDSSSALAALAALVGAEQECCSFFSFMLAVDSAGITFEVTAPPEYALMLATVFGAGS